MAKAMKVPVLVIENIEEVRIMITSLARWKHPDSKRVEGLLNELQKIKQIIENTNHS